MLTPPLSSSRKQPGGLATRVLPGQVPHCAEYVPRTGAFAYLVDRCARCNAKLEQHKKPTAPVLRPPRGQGELQYWLLRDIASDSGWTLRSRLQIMLDTCGNLADMHQAGLSYGPTLRATAIMCSSSGRGALRRPLVMPPRLDPFDLQHTARTQEDMLLFGRLVDLVSGRQHGNDSLAVLVQQLVANDEEQGDAENRPDGEAAQGWLEGIVADLGEDFSVPKFASSRHPFYGFIDLVTKENLQSIVSKSEDGGYESDDSFHPLGSTSRGGGGGGGDKTDDEDGGGNDTDNGGGGGDSDGGSDYSDAPSPASSPTRRSSRSGSVTSKLGSFLATTANSMAAAMATNTALVSGKRRSSLEQQASPSAAAPPPKKRSFRPLSTATRNNFKLSYGRTHLHVTRVPTPKQIAAMFDQQERISPEAASALLAQSEQMMRRETNVLEINDRQIVQVFGDIHGQYFDLRHALDLSGYSLEDEAEDRTLLFMGDYVDRGAWSCEVLFFLLALKLARPSRVFLLRGNHECGAVVSFFGFKEEMECKYGQTLFNKSLLTFQSMPLCAIVSTEQPVKKRWLVCHGGISPKLTSVVDDIQAINRFAEPGMNGLFCDLLWADPQMEIDEFAPNPSRGCSVRFGHEALKRCLHDNQLDGLIRGHEVMEDGVGVQDQVVTVFSAPNYCGRYGNRGAYLVIHPDREYEAVKFDSVPQQPHPRTFDSVVLETNARIGETLPFMPTTLGGFVNRALELYSATAAAAKAAEQQQAKLITSRLYDEEEEDSSSSSSEEEEEAPPASSPRARASAAANSSTLGVIQEEASLERLEQEEESFLQASEEPQTPLNVTLEEEEEQQQQLAMVVTPSSSPKRSTAFNIAKNKLSRAFSINKRFQTAKYSDGINEAHPSLTQFKIQSAELLLRMRFRKPQPATPAAAAPTTIADNAAAETDSEGRQSRDMSTPSPPVVETPPSAGHHQRSHSAAMDVSSLLLLDDNAPPTTPPSSSSAATTPTLRRVHSADRLLDMNHGHHHLLNTSASSSQSTSTSNNNRHSIGSSSTSTSFTSNNEDHHLLPNALLNMSVDSASFMSSTAAATPPPPAAPASSRRHSSKRGGAAAELFTPLGTLLSEVYPPIELASSSSHQAASSSSPSTTTSDASSSSPFRTTATNSSFSDSELRDLQLLFMLVDRSDDAKITVEELIQWSQDEGERVSEQDARRVVAAVDADGDGVIGLDDWLWFAHCCREVYNAELDAEIA